MKAGEMFTINTKSQLPIYEQIVQKIKEQVVKGVLQEGERYYLYVNLLVESE